MSSAAGQAVPVAPDPGSRLEVFPDAGHGVFRDQPTEALAVIRDFVLAAT